MENYTSDSSDSESNNRVIDLSFLKLETIQENLNEYIIDSKKHLEVEKLAIHHNILTILPDNISKFTNIRILDVSNNGLTFLPDVFNFCQLSSLIAKNNFLKNNSLPKTFSECPSLKELNLSGNQLEQFPDQVLDFVNLRYLYCGGNGMQNISKNIWKLKQLQVLSFGGNYLTEVPASLGLLNNLQALVLCDNYIESLPANIANLKNLKSLLLHKNKLKTLPPNIVTLQNLTELSLRDNPLVVRFVSDMTHNPASLLELSARSIKLHNIEVNPGDVPVTLIKYIDSGHHCVNPNCKGVFFDNRVEHIKFVDFCGKYRIPLLQYLCSSKCATTRPDEDVRPLRYYMMKKVLLG